MAERAKELKEVDELKVHTLKVEMKADSSKLKWQAKERRTREESSGSSQCS